jgi:hypothetical protein
MIDIKSGYLLPWQFRLGALLAIILALTTILYNPWLSGALLVASIFSLTSYEGTEVDPVNKLYREYTAWFLIKTGAFEKFGQAERIYITQGKESRQMYTAHTTHSSTFVNVVYNAYLKFSNEEKVHLLSDKNKNTLLKIISPLSNGLRVDVIDYTTDVG